MVELGVNVFIFAFGAAIGSFLNVCIYRMPRELSVRAPRRSFCPHCRQPISWYDNIPFISFIFLRGRCRRCSQRISPRYVLVEGITAAGAVIVYQVFGLTPAAGVYFALTCALIAATFIDFEFQIIPDEITIGGLAAGIILSVLLPQLHGTSSRLTALFQSLLGALAGGGSIYAIGKFGEFAFKKESMGGGDVKFLAMIGTILGWKSALLIFFIAPFFGAVVGIIARLRRGAEIIPYGPYLSLAAFLVLLWGNSILRYFFPY